MNFDDSETLYSHEKNYFDCLVIKKESSWKGGFDVVMLFVSCYNIFMNAYYSAFGIPTDPYFNYVDMAVESLFICDLVFCFCQEYLDEETYSVVTNIKQIAKHYLKKTFIVDFVACLPITNYID